MLTLTWSLLFFLLCGTICYSKRYNKKTHQLYGRNVIVQLFEWKWLDIADECERFLGPHGYAAVQTSPAAENLVIYLENGARSWQEKYQVMSYIIQTRSGSEEEFLNMTARCNKVGVRIYVDVVLNHMTRDQSLNGGTAGSNADFINFNYPAVPYSREDFNHPLCDIEDYDNLYEVRDCMHDGLKDLNQTLPYVRSKLVEYLDKLVSLGVAGFRVDTVNYMWPDDLKAIYGSVNKVRKRFGFQNCSRPYFYQEVNQSRVINASEYMHIGDIADNNGTKILYDVFNGQQPLNTLKSWGEASLNMVPSANSVVFVDSHYSQRYLESLSYKDGPKYRAALAFLLAHPHGQVRMMSSYYFDTNDRGPPSDSQNNITSPVIDNFGACDDKWVCEHRWNTTIRMLHFKHLVKGTKLRWFVSEKNQLAFSRGRKGFIAFNTSRKPMLVTLATGLPFGKYCDIRSGHTSVDVCTGKSVIVSERGLAEIAITGIDDDLYLAIHIGPESRLQTL